MQVCKRGEEKSVAQTFFHYRKEPPQLGLKRHLKAFSDLLIIHGKQPKWLLIYAFEV